MIDLWTGTHNFFIHIKNGKIGFIKGSNSRHANSGIMRRTNVRCAFPDFSTTLRVPPQIKERPSSAVACYGGWKGGNLSFSRNRFYWMDGLYVLGLQGSPRKKGSSEYLLTAFMQVVSDLGADVEILDIPRMNVRPCIGCGYCEKKGVCVIDDDDMATGIYAKLRQAEVVVAASPIFFYSVTAQLKTMIDRSQAFWSRKYRFKLADPLSSTRKGFCLSMGGSSGKNLFTCVRLVTNYFFDAIQAVPSGSLTYPNIENRDDFNALPNLQTDITEAAKNLILPLLERPRILVLGKTNGIRSQVAAALIQFHAGSRFEVLSAGSDPAREISPDIVSTMAEIGLDMAFRQPQSMESAQAFNPDHVIRMSPDIQIPVNHQGQVWTWDLPDPHGDAHISNQTLRKLIQDKVDEFLKLEI